MKKKILFLLSLSFIFVLLSYLCFNSVLVSVLSLIGVVFLLLISRFLFRLINKKYKNTNFYKNKFLDTLKFNSNMERNIKIINVGSNHPKFAFDYSECKVVGENWAIGPQSLEYDFNILKQYHSFLRNDAKVLIPICLFKFFLYRYDNNASTHKYYHILNRTLIHNFSEREKKLYIDYPILSAKRNLKRIIRDIPSDNHLDLEINPMNKNKLELDAMKWINGWRKQFNIDDLNNIELSDINKENINKNIKILEDMINFLLERKYEPIIVILPVTNELSDLVPSSFIDEYVFENIRKSNKADIKVLNYWKDSRFTLNNYYFNSFFMNKKGRSFFTKQVLKDLGI